MENRTQKLMEIIEQTKVISIRSKLEYCFKFFSKFTPTEAEIIYFISLNDDMTFKGSYVDLSDALGRGRGTGASTLSNIRKSVLKLADKGFITLEIKKLTNAKKVVSMAISDNFMSLLNADDIGVENLRAKKVST
jgi:hypothetical protein